MEDKFKDTRIQLLLQHCKEPRTSKEIIDYLKLKNKEYFRKETLKPLIESNMIILTIPDKPKSPKQKYYSK